MISDLGEDVRDPVEVLLGIASEMILEEMVL